jgi:hypothetical protein
MARRSEDQVKTCNHVKHNGNCCESPALKGDEYCYFHRAQRERTKRRLRAIRNFRPLELPPLDDMESIHLAIGEVLNALVADRIDHKKAGLLLYGLQTAATTIRHCDFEIDEYETHVARYTDRERVTLEQEVEEEIAAETAARKAQVEAVKSESQAASKPVASSTKRAGCPTSGEVPDVGNEAANPKLRRTTATALPEKKPASGVSKDVFWNVVGAMASQNAKQAAAEAKRLIEAADHALGQTKRKTGAV